MSGTWTPPGGPTEGNDTFVADNTGAVDIGGLNGNDSLVGSSFGDTMIGQGNDDTLAGLGGADSLHGGNAGTDFVDYGASGAAVTVVLNTSAAGGDAAGDTIAEFEGVIGSAQGDSLTGDANANTLLGGAGNDSLAGGGGTDSLLGGADNDSITGDADADTLVGNAGQDTIDGGDGADSIQGGDDDDSITGGAGADIITGEGVGATTGNDTIDGGADNDRLFGGAGDDSLLGGDGADTIFGNAGANVVDAGLGNDLVFWTTVGGADSLDGGDGTDTLDIVGVSGWTTVDGGNGYTQYNITGTQQFFFGRNFETALCFATGTLISTMKGGVPVEALKEGDVVFTRFGFGAKRIRWVGEQAFDGRFIARDRAPIRICAGALGDGLPVRDLVVSPAHAVVVEDTLVDARLLVNGTTVLQECVAGTIDYRHIDLGEHDCVLAEGTWAESYRETGDRRAFHNAAGVVARDLEQPCMPHVSAPDDPRLPALRARLAAPLARRA